MYNLVQEGKELVIIALPCNYGIIHIFCCSPFTNGYCMKHFPAHNVNISMINPSSVVSQFMGIYEKQISY